MKTFDENKEILSWVQDNTDLIRDLLVDLEEQKEQMLADEPIELHDDILQDFRKGAEFIVNREIQQNLQVNPESVMIFFEENDIVELLENYE